MEMKTGLLGAEEGKWDTANKLHKCLCAVQLGCWS